jgi:glycosyltransferase involved in cell wall biosynthesis
MRILIGCAQQNIVGGVETYLRDLLPALQRRGHELALVSEAPAAPGVATIRDGIPAVKMWCLSGAEFASTRKQIRLWNPDVAFSHGFDEPHAERMLVADYPTVLFAHNHAATCISGTRTMAFPAYQPCQRTFGPACLMHYLPRGCGGASPLTMLALYHRGKQRQSLLPHYRAVVVASRAMAVEYERHGVAKSRLHHVPLFPTEATGPDGVPTNRAFTNRVLLLGRLHKLKGGRVLVRALAKVNVARAEPLTLVVAGDGPEQEPIIKLARRLNVPLEFHGWLGAAERTALMGTVDLLALPSVCPETFGLVGLEAGSVGVPTVAFAVGGIPDWLVPGESGELAPGEFPSAASLAAALSRALASAAHWRKLALGAWRMARRFTLEAHVSRLEGILHKVAQFGKDVPRTSLIGALGATTACGSPTKP